jgi:hypothetical protein
VPDIWYQISGTRYLVMARHDDGLGQQGGSWVTILACQDDLPQVLGPSSWLTSSLYGAVTDDTPFLSLSTCVVS